jgi:LEA14-like dessication related protein
MIPLVRTRRTHSALACVSLLLAALSTAGCEQLFQKPRVSVRRVDIIGVSFTGLDAKLVLAVDNPNVLGIDLARLTYNLTVDNHAFVQGAGDHTLHVPAQGSGELQLPISIKFVELGQALASLFTKRQVPFSIATKLGFGTPIGVIDVPLSHSGQFPVPQLPTLTVGPATVGAIDVGGANMSVTINVRNSNSFKLPVGALKTGISVNGVSLVEASTPPRELAAGATVPLVIGARLDFLRAGMGIFKAVQSKSATVALSGSFDLLGYTMPVNLQTTLR